MILLTQETLEQMIVSERVALCQKRESDLSAKETEFARGKQEYKNISQTANQVKQYHLHMNSIFWGHRSL